MKILTITVKMICIISLLVNSAGEGYALRPMAFVSSSPAHKDTRYYEEGIKKLKERLKKEYHLTRRAEIALMSKIINSMADKYGAEGVLKLGRLNLSVLHTLIFEKKVRVLLNRFGIKVFIGIAKLRSERVKDALLNTAVFIKPETEEELLSYAKSFIKIDSYIGHRHIPKKGSHVRVFRYIIQKHEIDILMRLFRVLGSNNSPYLLDFADPDKDERGYYDVGMRDFLDKIKGSKEEIIDFIKILEFITQKYYRDKSRYLSRNDVLRKQQAENLIFLVNNERPKQVLRFLRLMGLDGTSWFLHNIGIYMKELIKEHGIALFIETAEQAGKKGYRWYPEVNYSIREVIAEFGIDILPSIARKAKAHTKAMFKEGIPLAMGYLERDKKNRKEKLLRYISALADATRIVRNETAEAVLEDEKNIIKGEIPRKGKTPEKIEKELFEWANFLSKMTRGLHEFDAKPRLSAIEPLMGQIVRFGKRPFVRIARYGTKEDGYGRDIVTGLLRGIYILRGFIKKEQDIDYYADKLYEIVETSKDTESIGYALMANFSLVRKFGIEKILGLARALERDTSTILRWTLPALQKLLKDDEDFEKLTKTLKAIKEDLGEDAFSVFSSGIPAIAYLLKSIEELEDYRPALAEIRKASGSNSIAVFYSAELFRKRIASKEALLKYMLPMARVAGYCNNKESKILENHFKYILKIEPDAADKICGLIDARIPSCDSAVSGRYARNIILSIAVCSRFGIDSFGLIEYLLKKKKSFELSGLAGYIDIASSFNGRTKRIADFINALPDSNAKYDLIRRILSQVELFYGKEERGPEEKIKKEKVQEAGRFLADLSGIIRLKEEKALLRRHSLSLERLYAFIKSLPFDEGELKHIKKKIKRKGFVKGYRQILDIALSRKPDFAKIWRLIEAYNAEVKSLLYDIKTHPKVEALYERIDELNRQTGQLKRDIERARRARNTRKIHQINKELKETVSELKRLSRKVKEIERLRNILEVPFQGLINRQLHNPDDKEYKARTEKLIIDAKIRIINMRIIRMRNKIYEARADEPLYYKEIELSSMVDRIAGLWHKLHDSREPIKEALSGLLRLYIKRAKPDEIIRHIYDDRALDRLKSYGYKPGPFIRGCSMRYNAAMAKDFILRKAESIKENIDELLKHIGEIGLKPEKILSDLGISMPGTYKEAKAIYEAVAEELKKEKADLRPGDKDILREIERHVGTIWDIETEKEKKELREGVEYYISTDPIEKMHLGAGFASCMNVENVLSGWTLGALGIGLSWGKAIAYVRGGYGKRIARRILILTDKGIIVYNDFQNTQLDLDYGWIRFLQKLGDKTGKDVIIPDEALSLREEFKKLLAKSGLDRVKEIKCKTVEITPGYFRFAYDLALGVAHGEFTIKSGYRIRPGEAQRKKPKLKKRRARTKTANKPERFRFLTDPLYNAALVNSMSNIIVKAHDLGIKTVLANGVSAGPAAQFFKFCWEKVYPDEEAPAVEFLGEAAGQVSMGRYGEEAVCAKISGLPDRRRVLENPILIIDDICFSGRTLKKTKDLLVHRVKAERVYTAALFQGEGEGFTPDLGAFHIEPRTFYLGSNWHLVRFHSIWSFHATGEFRQTPERLKEIFEEDLPHDLDLLSWRVLDRLQKRRCVPQEQYCIGMRIASAA